VQILSITLGVAAPGAGTSVLMGIDQRPTLTPDNILVEIV